MSLPYSDAIGPESYSRRYGSPGYGAHCLVADAGPVRVWYSYQTPIAFQVAGRPIVVSENVWSVTTGRHLNEICPDKSGRVPHDEFERHWMAEAAPVLEALAVLSAEEIQAAHAAHLLRLAAERGAA